MAATSSQTFIFQTLQSTMSLSAVLLMKRRRAQGKAGQATGFFKRKSLAQVAFHAGHVGSRKIMSIAGLITANNVKTMKKIFKSYGNKLTLVQFVTAMQVCIDKHKINSNEIEFAKEMIELYKQIDVNGDGLLEWSEFTSFIVGVGKTLNQKHDGIMQRKSQYVMAHATVQPTIARTMIKKMFVLGAPAHAVGVIYEGSQDLKLFTMPIRPDQHSLKYEKTLRHEDQLMPRQVLFATCIPEFNVLATCSVDAEKLTGTYLTFWGYEEEKRIPPRILARVRTNFPLDRICWCSAVNTLYGVTADASGYIYGWHVRPILVPKPSGVPEPGVQVTRTCTMHWHSEGVTDLFVIAGNVDTMLVSASKDGTLCMWNTRTSIPFYSIVAHDTGVKRAVYFERCDIVVTIAFGSVSYPKTMIPLVFDSVNDFEQIGSLDHDVYRHEYPLLDVSFQDGLRLENPHIVTVDERGNVRTWDASSLMLLQAFQSHDHLFPSGALAHDRLLNAAVCLVFEDVDAIKAEKEKGEEAHDKQIEADLRSMVIRGLFIPHAVPAILVATNQVCAFELRPVTASTESIIKVLFNEQSCTFLTCTVSRVQIWDAFDGVVLRQYTCEQLLGDSKAEITTCCLDDRMRKFILGDSFGRISVFNYLNGALMKELTPHSKAVSEICYCREDKILLSVAWDGRVLFSNESENEGHNESQRKYVLLRDIYVAPNPYTQGGVGMPSEVDLSCATFSYHFSAVVTTARATNVQGEDIRVLNTWDFEYAKLTGKYFCYGIPDAFQGQDKDASYDVTGIKVLEPYPAFVAYDTVGTLCIYVLPTSASDFSGGECAAVLRRSTASSLADQGSLGVMCCQVVSKDDEDLILYVGEENGRVAIWALTKKYMASLGLVPSQTWRKRTYSAARSMKDQRHHFQSICPSKPTYFPNVSDTHPIKVWPAHRAPISSIEVVKASGAVAISSLDGTCSLWSSNGVQRLGILDTDANKPRPTWRFRVDLTQRHREEREEAIDCLAKMRTSRTKGDLQETSRLPSVVGQVGSRSSPFRLKPIHSPKKEIGRLLLDTVGKKSHYLQSPRDEKAHATEIDSDADSVDLGRPKSSKIDQAMAAALNVKANSWRDTLVTRQKRLDRKARLDLAKEASLMYKLRERGKTASYRDRRKEQMKHKQMTANNMRATWTAPSLNIDNRSARSHAASDFMEELWMNNDGIQPMYSEVQDSMEISQHLGEYEVVSAHHGQDFRNEEVHHRGKYEWQSPSKTTRRETTKSPSLDSGRGGISAQIQRMKKEASDRSFSRLGRLSYQVI